MLITIKVIDFDLQFYSTIYLILWSYILYLLKKKKTKFKIYGQSIYVF